jgi:hypothetical protein
MSIVFDVRSIVLQHCTKSIKDSYELLQNSLLCYYCEIGHVAKTMIERSTSGSTTTRTLEGIRQQDLSGAAAKRAEKDRLTNEGVPD